MQYEQRLAGLLPLALTLEHEMWGLVLFGRAECELAHCGPETIGGPTNVTN